MTAVNMHEAKTRLSQLVESVETGAVDEVIIARNGKPVARLVALSEKPSNTSRRLGIGQGAFGALDETWFNEFQALDRVIWKGLAEDDGPPAKRSRRRPAGTKPIRAK